MDDKEICRLRGRKLALAAMRARGGVPSEDHEPDTWFRLPGEEGLVVVGDAEWARHDPHDPSEMVPNRPDRYMDQAWELDGPGWQWKFDEVVGTLQVLVRPDPDGYSYGVSVPFEEFATKGRAYATARTIGFVLVKSKGF